MWHIYAIWNRNISTKLNFLEITIFYVLKDKVYSFSWLSIVFLYIYKSRLQQMQWKSYSNLFFILNRELHFLRMNHRFERIKLWHCMNFRQHLTDDLREAWHTLYAMLLSNYKWDDTTDLLSLELGNNQYLCLASLQNDIPMTSLKSIWHSCYGYIMTSLV